MYRRIILGWAIICVIGSLALGYISTAYPFAKNVNIRPVGIDENTITLKGTVDVYFTDEAWSEFGYKRGNFRYFERYWESLEGQKFSYMGFDFRLIDIDWDLERHYSNHDRLSFYVRLRL